MSDGLAADLTGVWVWAGAGVVGTRLSATGTLGFEALLTGVEIFLPDCFGADFFEADYVNYSIILV